jgi:hypothetical protein
MSRAAFQSPKFCIAKLKDDKKQTAEKAKALLLGVWKKEFKFRECGLCDVKCSALNPRAPIGRDLRCLGLETNVSEAAVRSMCADCLVQYTRAVACLKVEAAKGFCVILTRANGIQRVCNVDEAVFRSLFHSEYVSVSEFRDKHTQIGSSMFRVTAMTTTSISILEVKNNHSVASLCCVNVFES